MSVADEDTPTVQGSPREADGVSSLLLRLRMWVRAPQRSVHNGRFVDLIGGSATASWHEPESIAAEAALDGLYVVRTSLAQTRLDAEGAVRAYKRLSAVERAFRSLKTVDLKVRPVFHRTADRVRAHVFLCMLAYYVEWHMRARLKPLLFDDHDPAAAEAARTSIVAPARVSEAAGEKARGKRTADGLPVHRRKRGRGACSCPRGLHGNAAACLGAAPYSKLSNSSTVLKNRIKKSYRILVVSLSEPHPESGSERSPRGAPASPRGAPRATASPAAWGVPAGPASRPTAGTPPAPRRSG